MSGVKLVARVVKVPDLRICNQ